jgi:hypothetical protein
MTSDRKKPGVAFWATVGLTIALLVALCFYVGAYAWMVRPVPVALDVCLPAERVDPDYTGASLSTTGHRDQEFWMKFFGPVHRIDRLIRRETWSIR